MAEEEKKTEAAPPSATGNDVDKGKGIAWLSYIGILWLVPLLAQKENDFCKFHVKQGIMLTIWFFAIGIVGAIPFIGWFLIWPLGVLFGLILAILGIINAASGKYWKMPLLGKLAENWFKF
ncbi:MAG: DUF4870 domain-containing protein [candidate division WOR-3 bacterium]|jgi:uncharacterized membrane protein